MKSEYTSRTTALENALRKTSPGDERKVVRPLEDGRIQWLLNVGKKVLIF